MTENLTLHSAFCSQLIERSDRLAAADKSIGNAIDALEACQQKINDAALTGGNEISSTVDILKNLRAEIDARLRAHLRAAKLKEVQGRGWKDALAVYSDELDDRLKAEDRPFTHAELEVMSSECTELSWMFEEARADFAARQEAARQATEQEG